MTLIEHVMSLTVAARWSGFSSAASKGTIVVSAILILGVTISMMVRPFKFLLNRKLNLINIAKKIVYGMLVCLDINPLILPLLMFVVLIMECTLEYRESKYKEWRMILYKLM
jgi:hypothetical protein